MQLIEFGIYVYSIMAVSLNLLIFTLYGEREAVLVKTPR